MLIQFNLLKLNNEQLSETIQRVLSDKTSSHEEKLVVSWIRDYCDGIPYEKKVKEEILNKILFVKNIDNIQKIPFKTTRYGYESKVYQAINTKKLIQELIIKGIYPQNYFQSQTKWRGANAFLSQEERDSREIQVVRCVDHSTLRDAQNNHVFLEIFRKTGLAPSIEIRNAHTGKNACFMIISLVNTDFKSFGLRSTYHPDSLFGVRLEHRDLGDNYEGIYNSIEKLSSQYGQLLDIITRMQGQYLLSEQREMMKQAIAQLIFGKYNDRYECDLSYLFDEKFEDRKTLWDRMIFIQEQLYKEISYIYINEDGKRINRKKKLSELKWTSSQKIIGRLFELFESQLKFN
jgi:hypothetical protein